MPVVGVRYPGIPFKRVKLEPVYVAPGRGEFDSIAASMLPSRVTFPSSRQITKYNAQVLGTKEVRYGHTDDIGVVAAVLHVLQLADQTRRTGAVIDVCAGIGTLTTPIATKFRKVLALEVNGHFVNKYSTYLRKPHAAALKGRVTCKRVDLSDIYGTLAEARSWLRSIQSETPSLHAVIINPPYMRPALVAHSFLVACELRPHVIVAVMPLDILWELAGGYTSRCDDDPSSGKASARYLQVQSDAMFLRGVRETLRWRLSLLIPHYRPDGTAEYATMQFSNPQPVQKTRRTTA
jgi:hypothetical protein